MGWGGSTGGQSLGLETRALCNARERERRPNRGFGGVSQQVAAAAAAAAKVPWFEPRRVTRSSSSSSGSQADGDLLRRDSLKTSINLLSHSTEARLTNYTLSSRPSEEL